MRHEIKSKDQEHGHPEKQKTQVNCHKANPHITIQLHILLGQNHEGPQQATHQKRYRFIERMVNGNDIGGWILGPR